MENQVVQYILSSLPLVRLLQRLIDRIVLFNHLMHILLEASHMAGVVLYDLWRQFLQHISLRPPQYERCDPFLQRLQSLQKALALLKLLRQLLNIGRQVLIILPPKLILLLQKPRHQKVKYGPQLTDPILQRSPREHNLLLTGQVLHSLRYL